MKKRNELVIQGTRIGVWDWNVQTGEAYFDERYAEIIGYTLKEFNESPFDTWVEFTHPDDVATCTTLLQEHFDGDSEYYDAEIRMRHKKGHWVWVHSRGKVFEWDENGKPLRMCGSHTDISAQKETELKLLETIKERDLLLKEVHHRVKNNLQLLLSLSRIKSHDGLIKTDEIEDSINAMAKAYEAIYKSKKVYTLNLCEHIKTIVDSAIEDYDIELDMSADRCEKNVDFVIPMGLVINELVSNTIKHGLAANKNPKIQIQLKHSAETLDITYRDNGKGFPKAVLTKEENPNSFGISIVRNLLKQLNGSIKLSNDGGAVAKIEIQEGLI